MKTKQYNWATDSASGKIEAESLHRAYRKLRLRITPMMILEGATLWVAEEDGSNRIEMGKDEE